MNNSYMPLTKKGARAYWVNRLKELQKVKQLEGGTEIRYNRGLHQIRSIFRTRWAKVLMEGISGEAQSKMGEYFLGHTIDKLGYNRIHKDREYRLRLYKMALLWLDAEKQNIERQSEELEAYKLKVEDLEARLRDEQERRRTLEESLSNYEDRIRRVEKTMTRSIDAIVVKKDDKP